MKSNLLIYNTNDVFNYSDEDNSIWKILIERQLSLVKKVACEEYIEGLERLDFSKNYIPSIDEMNEKLSILSGWRLEPVDILVPNRVFFEMLSQKTFPAIRVIRKKEEIDFYTNEAPDVFHEFFGHCPLLIHPVYSECIQQFGECAKFCSEGTLLQLSKIFWATFEFGLIKKSDGIKIYGAGILPSRQEVMRVMDPKNINIKQLNIFADLDSSLRGNINQPTYYCLDKLEVLIDIVKNDLPLLITEKTIEFAQ